MKVIQYVVGLGLSLLYLRDNHSVPASEKDGEPRKVSKVRKVGIKSGTFY